ncbi:MAG: acetate--CoA ligase [Anaerolineae bacterium]|nr:MAG: acetate--CoA ligase [Anaerolineae bacterium]
MSLAQFFSPQSIAVVGASTDPTKLGHVILNNLLSGNFLGPGRTLYPINPKAKEILGQTAYASVLDVPDPIDLAVIAIPYPTVPAAVAECGEKGVPAAIVISAGFREAGLEGAARERELLEVANKYDVRLIGPNCFGVIDTFTPMNATFSAGMPPAGPMGFMSQSGALGAAILDWAMAGRLGLSKFVSLGNKADVSESDLLREWADDPSLRVILIYTEGLPDGQEFIRVARRVSKVKPVVAIKSGITQAGARAVSSHTGSLAGSEQAYTAAFRQAGVIRANSLEELLDFALAFGYLPPLEGDRVAIVTNAGGPGILATDAVEHYGLKLARFEPERLKELEQFLPDAASAANPVDLLGDAREDRYEFVLDKIIGDPNVDAILVLVTPQAMTDVERTAEVIVDAASRAGVPVLACLMGQASLGRGPEILNSNNVPRFPFPERAARALYAMNSYRKYGQEPLPEFETQAVEREAVEQVIQSVREAGRLTIGDFESRDILAAYGFAAPEAELAGSADEALDIARQIGYPVVLKVASPDILHKTDVGGVRVGLQDAADVRDAFDLITYRATRYLPEARLWGCMVQKMAPPGLEVLIGMNRDPQFGPLVTFALGGIYVEILKDAAFRLAPFSRAEAKAMLDEIRASALLEGVRGEPPADRGALVDALLRVGQLVTDFPEIEELDINPFVVYERGQGGAALDMRLVLAAQSHGSGSRSQP